MTQPTNTVAWFAGAAGVPTVDLPQTEVLIDGAAEPRVRLDWLETQLGAAPRAHFSAGLGHSPLTGEDARLEHLAPRVRPGAAVTARLLRGGAWPGDAADGLVLFEGRITRLHVQLDPGGEALAFEAEDPAEEVLRRRLGGQRAWAADDSAAHLDGPPLVFNPDGRSNASATLYTPSGGEAHRIFAPAGAPDAEAWTLDEAVAYVLAEYGESPALAVPGRGEVRAAVGGIVLNDVRLEGRTLAEALDALLELAGARFRVAAEPGPAGVSRRLELVVPGGGPVVWLSHQRPGETFDPRCTHLASLAARMEFDAAPRRYVARGDRKVYESTFDLVAGWDASLETAEPDDFSPGANTNFVAVRDVFRKWVLNEAGEYSDPPYGGGPAPDLATVFEGAAYVRRRRRFLPCLSRDMLGRSRGVYAEVSLDGGSSWRRMTVGVRNLTEECGLYLADDPLPPEYLAAAMRGQTRVRVTATIESDSCLAAEQTAPDATGLPGRTRHIAAPAGFRFRRVAAASCFSGEGGADVADDTARLQELVDAAHAADRRCPAPARITIPALALAHRDGRRVAGLRGRRLDLARQHAGYETAPVIRSVRHTFAPAPQTELELE